MNVLYNKCNLGLLNTVREEPRDITNVPTLSMRATLASFHVARQVSINLRLCSRRVFLVAYSTCVLIMVVGKALVLR